MSDLISKKELKDYLERNISFGGVEKKFEFYDMIDSIPSADIMEYVRAIKEYCKENQSNCENCQFQLFENDYKICLMQITSPMYWDLPESEKGGAE